MKWNKNAASQKGRVFRSGLLSTAMLAAVLVLAVLLNLLVRPSLQNIRSSTFPRPKCTP